MILLTHRTAAGHRWTLSYAPGSEDDTLDAIQHNHWRDILTHTEAEMIAETVGRLAAKRVKAEDR